MISRKQYLLNFVWGFLGAAQMILAGALVAPILIRALGSEQFGIWALGLSMVEYFWMVDLGLRPAIIKLTAEHRAREEWHHLNLLLSTACAYSFAVGLLVAAALWFGADWAARFLHISHPDFPWLVRVVALSFGGGLTFNVFSAGLEGFQRFDLVSRAFVLVSLARSLALVSLVWSGFGLREMAWVLLATQTLTYFSFWNGFRRVFPQLALSPRHVNRHSARQLFRFATTVVGALLSVRILQSALPALVTYFLGVRYVTFYSTTQRLIDYANEGIARIGLVVGPRVADWLARGWQDRVLALVRETNRYCLALWLSLATFLWVYGDALFTVWINAEFARESYPILRIWLAAYSCWVGLWISAATLMNAGRYAAYSAGLLAEACLQVAAFAFLLPRWGLTAAVAAGAALALLARFANLLRIFSREFSIAPIRFVLSIYPRPLLLAAASVALLLLVRQLLLPGRNFWELAVAASLHFALYSAAAFFWLLAPHHRELAITTLHQRWRSLIAASSRA
jgi:O-antigen/teichoic acid export membrane protein